MEDKSEKEQKRQFKVYVGSIPGCIDSNEILHYFKRFGWILRVRMFYIEGETNINKGYCHVIVKDSKTLNNILYAKEHRLQGRKLYCSPCISGRKLKNHNNSSNSRRIVVRNIPNNLESQHLKEIFSSFGEVEMAYIFSSPQELGTKRPKNSTQTGSVQFKESSIVQEMISKGKVSFWLNSNKEQTFSIFPYIHNYTLYKSTHREVQEIITKEENPIKTHFDGVLEDKTAHTNSWKLSHSRLQRKCIAVKVFQSTVSFHSIRPTKKEYFSQKVLIRELALDPQLDIRMNQPTRMATTGARHSEGIMGETGSLNRNEVISEEIEFTFAKQSSTHSQTVKNSNLSNIAGFFTEQEPPKIFCSGLIMPSVIISRESNKRLCLTGPVVQLASKIFTRGMGRPVCACSEESVSSPVGSNGDDTSKRNRGRFLNCAADLLGSARHKRVNPALTCSNGSFPLTDRYV